MGEDHRPGARLRTGTRALSGQLPLHFFEQDAQDPTCQRRVAVQKTAQAFRQGQHPLVYRYQRNGRDRKGRFLLCQGGEQVVANGAAG